MLAANGEFAGKSSLKILRTAPFCRVTCHRGGIQMNLKRTLLAICVLACWTGSISGQNLPKAKQREDAGFSPERLDRLNKFFQGEIDKGGIPGAVLLVTRENKLAYLQALGYQDREKHLPMKADAIFRIASMTKPVTSVAVMMLAEEGKIDLLAPVS